MNNVSTGSLRCFIYLFILVYSNTEYNSYRYRRYLVVCSTTPCKLSWLSEADAKLTFRCKESDIHYIPLYTWRNHLGQAGYLQRSMTPLSVLLFPCADKTRSYFLILWGWSVNWNNSPEKTFFCIPYVIWLLNGDNLLTFSKDNYQKIRTG